MKNYRHWLGWFVSSIFYLYEYTHRVSISVIIPELSTAFNASATDISSLSASYFYVYAAMQIPAGFIVDKYSTKIILPIASIMTAIGCLMFANTNQLLTANIARGFIGFGSAFAFVSCLKIASQQIDPRKFAFVVGITNFLGALGGFLGGEPYLLLVRQIGWRQVTIISSYIAIFFAIILWFAINPKYNTRFDTEDKKNSFPKFSLFNSRVWLISVLASLMISPINTYTQLWGATFLETHNNLNLAQASLLSSVTFFGIAFGGPLIGYLNSNLITTKSLLYLGVIGALSSLSIILFVSINNSFYLAMMHLLLGIFTSSMILCFSMITKTVEPEHHGTVIGTLNAMITFMGASFQILAGKIIEANNQDILLGMLPLIACYLISFALINKIK